MAFAVDNDIDGYKNTKYVFEESNFSYTADVGEEFQSIEITTLPLLGTLKLNDVAIQALDQIDVDEIENITYEGVTDGYGDSYSTFTFKVYVGDEWSLNAATITINLENILTGNPITVIIDEINTIIPDIQLPIYQKNWGTVGIWDETKQTTPAAYVEFLEEVNTDFNGTGTETFASVNVCRIKITIYDKLTEIVTNPRKAIENVLLNDLVCFKKLFYNNNTLNSKADHIKYSDSKPIHYGSNDLLQSAQLETIWEVQYQQSWIEPINRR